MKFSCLRSHCAGDYNSEEVRLYKELLPHLARAARIQRRFAFLQSLSSSSLSVLDTVPAGVILLDARGRVLHTNRAAEQELQRADPLATDLVGELCSRGPVRAHNALRAAITAAAVLDPIRGRKERVPSVVTRQSQHGENATQECICHDGGASARGAGPPLAWGDTASIARGSVPMIDR